LVLKTKHMRKGGGIPRKVFQIEKKERKKRGSKNWQEYLRPTSNGDGSDL